MLGVLTAQEGVLTAQRKDKNQNTWPSQQFRDTAAILQPGPHSSRCSRSAGAVELNPFDTGLTQGIIFAKPIGKNSNHEANGLLRGTATPARVTP